MPTKKDLEEEIVTLKAEIKRLEALDPLAPLKQAAANARDNLSTAFDTFSNAVPAYDEGKYPYSELPDTVEEAIENISQWV